MSSKTVARAGASSLDKLVAEGHQAMAQMVGDVQNFAKHRAHFGAILIDYKQAVGHGGWERAVREHFDISPGMAWRYMECARQLKENPNLHRDEDFGLNAVRKGRIELPSPKDLSQPKPKPQAPPDTRAGGIIGRAQEAVAGVVAAVAAPVIDATAVEATQADPPVDLTKPDMLVWEGLRPKAAQIVRRIEGSSGLNPASAEKQLVRAANETRQLVIDLERIAAACHRLT